MIVQVTHYFVLNQSLHKSESTGRRSAPVLPVTGRSEPGGNTLFTTMQDRKVQQTITSNQKETDSNRGIKRKRDAEREEDCTGFSLKEARKLMEAASELESKSNLKRPSYFQLKMANAQKHRIHALNILEDLSKQAPTDKDISYAYAFVLESLWKFDQCIRYCQMQLQPEVTVTWPVFKVRMEVSLKNITPDKPAAMPVVKMLPHELSQALYYLKDDLNIQDDACLPDAEDTAEKHIEDIDWLSNLFSNLLSTLKSEATDSPSQPEPLKNSSTETTDEQVSDETPDGRGKPTALSAKAIQPLKVGRSYLLAAKANRYQYARQDNVNPHPVTGRNGIVQTHPRDHYQPKMQTLGKIGRKLAPSSSNSKTAEEQPGWNIWTSPLPLGFSLQPKQDKPHCTNISKLQ